MSDMTYRQPDHFDRGTPVRLTFDAGCASVGYVLDVSDDGATFDLEFPSTDGQRAGVFVPGRVARVTLPAHCVVALCEWRDPVPCQYDATTTVHPWDDEPANLCPHHTRESLLIALDGSMTR